MGIRIGFLALCPEIIAMVKSASAKLPRDVEVVVEDTNPLDFDCILATAKRLGKDSDIIICRSGTKAQLEHHISLPIIDLPYTLSDVLTAFYEARKKGNNLMLVLSRMADQDLGPWPEVLGITVTKALVDFLEEIEPAVLKAKELGAIVVGGSTQVLYASSFGVESQYILSSEATILESLHKAIDIVRAANKEKERTARLQALLDFAREGIIFLESDNKVGNINTAATEILKTPRAQLIGLDMIDILKRDSNGDEAIESTRTTYPLTGKLLKINNLSIMANIVPIRADQRIIGRVITFFEATRLQNLEHNLRRQMARRAMVAKFNFEDIIGTSQAIEFVKQQAETYATTDSTVAIYGESGVGKELFAQSIHNLSNRRNGPFVAINCSALPKELMESELFGYEEGAFTGAKKGGKEGLFELAHGGTLFLDEIGTMPLELQSKILRVIQEREVTRIGGGSLIPVNVRIIVATNRDLRDAVRKGEFRQDLFFRLNVLPLNVPPLRARPEDILVLAEHFIDSFSKEMGRTINMDIFYGVDLLKDCYWPGNVRELKNFCERFVAMASQQVDQEKLLEQLLAESCQETNSSPTLSVPMNGSWKETWHDLERDLLEQMLNERGITKTALAKSLGISRTALWKKLKEKSAEFPAHT